MNKVIFEEEYAGEGIADMERDVSEAFDENFNTKIKDIPHDQDGFPLGSFKLTIEFIGE